MSDHALPLRLIPEHDETPAEGTALVESYRRLADVFHDVLGEQSLDALLDRIADALADLIPHDSLTIYEADEPRRLLIPVWARDKWINRRRGSDGELQTMVGLGPVVRGRAE